MAPSNESQLEHDLPGKPRASPAAECAPPKELSQLDRDIAGKQKAAPPPPAAAPGEYPAPGAYSTAPGAHSGLPPMAAATPPPSSPTKKSPPDSGMQAKEREKALRKQALSQRNLVVGAAKAPPSPLKKSPPSADPGMQAKEREKQLRKEALSQRNLMAGAAKAPPTSPKKNPPAVDPGMQAKEREKLLRKEALSQRNLMTAAVKPPPSPSTQTDPGMQAKEREKQLRKEALSQRNLMAGGAKAPPSPPMKSPPAALSQMDRDIAAKQRASPRATAPGAYSAPGATAVLAAPGAYSAPPTGKQSQLDRDIAAKQRAAPPRSHAAPGAYSAGPGELSALDQRIAAKQGGGASVASSSAVSYARPGAYAAPPGELSELDQRIATKQGGGASVASSTPSVHSAAVSHARPGAYSAPPGELSELDQRIATKQGGGASVAFPTPSVHSAAASHATPGAYSAPPGELSNLDQRIAAKQGAAPVSLAAAAPPAAGLPAPGAYSAPPGELSQLDNRIAAKQGGGASVASGATPSDHSAAASSATPGAFSAPPGELSQLDQRIASKQNAVPQAPGEMPLTATLSRQRSGPQPEDDGSGRSSPSVPPVVESSLGHENEADVTIRQRVGAFCATRFQAPQKGQPADTQTTVSEEDFQDEGDLEAPPCQPEQAPLQLAPHEARAPSYRLTQQPQQQEIYVSPPLPEETVAITSHHPLSPAASNDSADMGLNLVEATLVVEEMVEATVATPMEFQQDEVMKIREQSAEETAKIQRWRILVSLALVATAIAVTTSTYMLLVEREDQNFRNVYYQFATTVADAAVEQQANIRDSLFSFADSVATMAEAAGQGTSPWPYFVVPHWETLARGFKSTSNAEFIAIQNYVPHELRDDYVDFITPIYQDFVQEAHMEAYGHIDFLNNDTAKYQPFIAQKLPNKTFVPDIERPFYFARTTQSPPARAYGPTINNNLIANKVIGDGFAAVMAMHNESVFTPIKPFANVPPEEHAKMHSNGAEGANNPHSFTFHPVHRQAGNQSSDIVAMFACATAWDFSMLNLLPDNVKGMYCLVENTCNQTVTYRIDGGNATYLGEGELQPPEFHDMAVFVDLSLQEHPDARTTPGHCMYSMRIYPSKAFEADYKTSTPAIYAGVVAGTFVLIAAMLFVYDLTVTKRNEKMIFQAAKTNAILSKFVPDHLRDRIMGFNSKPGEVARRGSQELDKSFVDINKVGQEIDKSMAKSKMDASLGVGSHARRALP